MIRPCWGVHSLTFHHHLRWPTSGFVRYKLPIDDIGLKFSSPQHLGAENWTNHCAIPKIHESTHFFRGENFRGVVKNLKSKNPRNLIKKHMFIFFADVFVCVVVEAATIPDGFFTLRSK